MHHSQSADSDSTDRSASFTHDACTDETFSSATFSNATLWEQVRTLLKNSLNQPSYETWIHPLSFCGLDGDKMQLTAPSDFNRDWVMKNYRAQLTQAFSACLDHPVTIDVGVVAPTASELHSAQEEAPPEDTTEISSSASLTKPEGKWRPWTPKTLKSNLNPRYTFENCVVGNHNRFCHAAALAVAETPAQTYNPFFIYGGVGLGKTHLMQAIAHFALRHHPELQVRYVTAEQFTNDLIHALSTKTMKAFRDKYRKIDLLMIDDVQFLEGKERTQEEIFHTFNALHQSGKQIVLSSDRPPQTLTALEDRLRSRFEWGLIADIQSPDVETRQAILQQKSDRENISVCPDVLKLIAGHYPNNVRELEGAFNKITAYSMLTNTILDVETARSVLGMQINPIQVSQDKIIDVVARYYHLHSSDLKSSSRAKDVSHARQVAIYIIREMTNASFPKIAELMGKRTHTTILYAYEKIKTDLMQHPTLGQQIQEITARVKAGR